MLPKKYHYLFPRNIQTHHGGAKFPTIFPEKGTKLFVKRRYFRMDKSLPGAPASVNCCGERHTVRPSEDWKSLVFENHADLAELEMMEAFGDEKSLRCLEVSRAWNRLMDVDGRDPNARKVLPPALRRSLDFIVGKQEGRPGGVEYTLESMRYIERRTSEPDKWREGASRRRVELKLMRKAEMRAANLRRSTGVGMLPRFKTILEWREEIWKPGLHRAVLESGGLRKAVVVGRAFLMDEKTAKVLVCWPLQHNAALLNRNHPDHSMVWATAHLKSEEEMEDYSHLPEEERPFPFWEITLDKEEK